MIDISFLNGIIDLDGISERYEAVIQKMIAGNYSGLNIEKLKGYDVYSVRANLPGRLLFTKVKQDGKSYLVLLDEVPNHDYDKSRFLKNKRVLANYLELQANAIQEQITDTNFEATPFAQEQAATNDNADARITYKRMDFYNQQFIELDEEQLATVAQSQKSLPMIISGGPGSGKTFIAISLFNQYVALNKDKEDAWPILYVAESQRLVNSMQHVWQSQLNAQDLPADAVQFKTYEQLIKEHAAETAKMNFVEKEHCYHWLKTSIEGLNSAQKANIGKADFFADLDSMYQEFRIISGL